MQTEQRRTQLAGLRAQLRDPSMLGARGRPMKQKEIKTHPRNDGTVELRNVQVMLTPAEANVLKRTLPATLGEVMAALPMPKPGQYPKGTITARLFAVPVPERDAERLAKLWGERRGEQRRTTRADLIRAALHELGVAHLRDEWELTSELHPGTAQTRERVSVGPGRWVARAAWRRKADGKPRNGRKGARSLLLVTTRQAGLPEPYEPHELMNEKWETLEVFGARSLHEAAASYILDKPDLRRPLPSDLLIADNPERHIQLRR